MPRYGYLLPTRGSVLTSGDAQTLAAKTAADVVGLAGRAEALGFSSVWVGDSVLAKPRHDPFTTLAAVASATEAVGLGTAVHLPVLRNPVHVAHRTATLDQVSGGRLRWGVGVGRGSDVAAEYANVGVPYGERGARLDELLDVVTALWSGEPVDYDGEFYSLSEASIGFSPPSDPPIYLATSAFDAEDGIPAPIESRLVEHGAGWLPITLAPADYEAGVAAVREALADAGRGGDPFDAAMYLDVVIDEDEERAVETARAFYEGYYTAWDHPLSDETIRDIGVYGPAGTVAEAVEAYADAGVETLVVRFTAPDQREQLRRFADLVR